MNRSMAIPDHAYRIGRRFFVVNSCCQVKDELGVSVDSPTDDEWDMAEFVVPHSTVRTNLTYHVSVMWRDTMRNLPYAMTFMETDGPLEGYRHRFRTDKTTGNEYGITIPIWFPTLDPRIRYGTTSWRINAGTFWSYWRKRESVRLPAKFIYEPTDRVPSMRLVANCREYIIPAQ